MILLKAPVATGLEVLTMLARRRLTDKIAALAVPTAAVTAVLVIAGADSALHHPASATLDAALPIPAMTGQGHAQPRLAMPNESPPGTVPFGVSRVGHSMQGYAAAVEWYDEYVYLAASTILQVYHAPPGARPRLVHEIEFRDWIREMAEDGGMLFVAARGDGLFAFDVSESPWEPVLADSVTGMFDLPEHGPVEAVFNGVHAADGMVAAARVNNVPKARGGVDVLVFRYERGAGRLVLDQAIDTGVRAKASTEVPITTGVTADGGGVYIGYGVLTGELVYVPLGPDAGAVLHADFGAPFDIATVGNDAYVANTGLCAAGVECPMLLRVFHQDDALQTEPMITNPGSSAGGAVDVDGDLLCFGTWSPARYEGGSNLWTFTGVQSSRPRRASTAGTPDWIFQIACRDTAQASDAVYVADEWGGLEIWRDVDGALTMDLAEQRVATGALSEGIWSDGTSIYAVKRGAGLWLADERTPESPRPIVEWIDRSDPGCGCAGCCPPTVGPRPYPPAVFVFAGASTQGRIAVFAQDRNTAVAGDGYFMLFEPDDQSDEFTLVYSEPVAAWGGPLLVPHAGNLLFAASAPNTVRMYQHCPGRIDHMRLVADIVVPGPSAGMLLTDLAIDGEFVFVTQVHKPLLGAPDTGQVHAFRVNQGVPVACPDRPTPPAVDYLGSFAEDVTAYSLAIDGSRQLLFLGASAHHAFPIRSGALFAYDLATFDPEALEEMDSQRIDLVPPRELRVGPPNIHDVLVDGDGLYVVDFDNGVYRLNLSTNEYVGFWPAHRGTESQAFVAQLVRTPPGVVPLYHPTSAALLPSGRVVVHEHNSGRATLLRFGASNRDVLLPWVQGH